MQQSTVLDWSEFFQTPKVGEKKSDTVVLNKPTSKLQDLGKTGVVLTACTLFTAAVLPELIPAFYFPPPETWTAVSATTDQFITVTAPPAGDGWDRLISKVVWITDKLMSGVIIFSGISWMFGNRTKAIELLFGAGVGYVIVRHHEDIKNFFALL